MSSQDKTIATDWRVAHDFPARTALAIEALVCVIYSLLFWLKFFLSGEEIDNYRIRKARYCVKENGEDNGEAEQEVKSLEE